MTGHPTSRRIGTLAAAAALAALTACSTTVTGSGSFAGDTSGPPGPGTTGSQSPGPTGSAGPGRSSLSCSGGTVQQPSNAPYCYLLPAGFKDVSAQTSTTVGQTGEHPSSVALAGDTITPAVRDLIIVLDFSLHLDTDALSDEQLVQQLNVLISQFEAQGFSFTSRVPEQTRLDGARAFTYHAKAREGYGSDIVFAFRGKQEVEVNCQFKVHQADIRRACGSILASLQFTGQS